MCVCVWGGGGKGAELKGFSEAGSGGSLYSVCPEVGLCYLYRTGGGCYIITKMLGSWIMYADCYMKFCQIPHINESPLSLTGFLWVKFAKTKGNPNPMNGWMDKCMKYTPYCRNVVQEKEL